LGLISTLLGDIQDGFFFLFRWEREFSFYQSGTFTVDDDLWNNNNNNNDVEDDEKEITR